MGLSWAMQEGPGAIRLKCLLEGLGGRDNSHSQRENDLLSLGGLFTFLESLIILTTGCLMVFQTCASLHVGCRHPPSFPTSPLSEHHTILTDSSPPSLENH